MKVASKKYNFMLARLFLVSTAFSIWLLFYYSHQDKKEEYSLVSRQLTTETKRFRSLNDEKLLIDEYSDRLDKLKPVEKFKTENRLALLDALEKIQKKHRLTTFDYQIDPRMAYRFNDGVLTSKGIKVFRSDIKLEFNVLHEAQLMNVLSDLRAMKPAAFMLDGCQLLMQNAASLEADYNLKAACSLKWYSFDF